VLLDTRRRFNAEINRLEAALAQALTGPVLQRTVAILEQSRAQGNAQIDQLRAGCPPPNV
jgi:hypothetical protein